MKSFVNLFGQFALGLMICSGLAVGMSYLGSEEVVGGQEQRRAIGHCRQCGNPIRFEEGSWVASCRTCGQLTNSDQLPDRN